MQLYGLSDQELWENTRVFAEQERALTVKVLWHIREIERRRLHLERGYDSLQTYLVKELKYSAGSAARRVDAMRLLKELPGLELKVKSGELTLSNLSQVGQFFKQERKSGKSYSSEQKQALLVQIEGKSTRDCERMLVEISPGSAATLKDRKRQVNAEQFELKMILNKKQMLDFERAKKIFQTTSKSGGTSLADVLEELSEFYLDHKDEERKLKRGVEREKKQTTPAPELEKNSDFVGERKINAMFAAVRSSRYATAQTKREVFARAGEYRCSFVDSRTKKQCPATHGLHLDHRQPWAKGGSTTPENLRYLCAAHNRLEAIRVYGPEKMWAYVQTS